MTPLIRHGDIITVQPVDILDLRLGDVILYQTAMDKLVAHRIIDIGVEDGQIQFLARGDAILGSGEKVPSDKVLGQVIWIERGSRVIQLDTHGWRRLGILWGKLAPVTLRLRYIVNWVAIRFMTRLSSSKMYRKVARKWFKDRTCIRFAEPDDAHDLYLLHGNDKYSGIEDRDFALGRQMQTLKGDAFILVAYIEDRLAGSLTVKRSSNEKTLYPGWWLFGMLVRLRYRGAGNGLKLLNQTLKEAAVKGASQLNLLVEEDNRAALGLYYKLGFQPLSIPELEVELESEVKNGLPRRIILSRSLDNPGE